jgi:FtsP/CotA-like multicopper oxidase with cupredoxin domain
MFHAPSTAPTVPAHPPAKVPLGRRLLLGLVPLASLALVAAACTGARTSTSPGPVARAAQVVGGRLIVESYAFDTLTQPMEITSRGGVLDLTLAAVWQNLPVPDTNNAPTMRLRTYQVLRANGVDYSDSAAYGYPGPTLRAYRGDSIHIVLQNQLYPLDSNTECIDYPASADSIDSFEDCFHGANWTNIHYHGMHVTPDSVGDDVLLLIPPGDSHEYGFRIPFNQSPGTHWYHPHKHGSVAIQVMNGMTGALIVDGGGLDSLADAHGMVEKVIAMQQIDSLPNLIDAPANPATPQTLVNGRVTPVVVMRPGEVQRWRLVDENVTKTAAFSVAFYDTVGEEPAMYDVARDGVTYADTNYAPGGVMTPDTAVLVAPGNRLDVFVQAPSTGGLFQLRGTPVFHDRPGDNTRKEGLRDDQNPATVRGRQVSATTVATGATPLFYVYVDSTLAPNGSSLPTSLPALPSFLQNLPGTLDPTAILADSANLAVVVFSQQATGSGNTVSTPPRFFLGTQQSPNMQFHSDSVYVPRNASNDSLPMVLDSVQTWKVVNTSTVNHPFHIHINPFQVIDVYYPNSGDPNATLYAQLDSAAQVRGSPIWLDVIPLPKASGSTPGYVLIRQGYEPFLNADGSTCTSCGPAYGEFVMHCHILGHEERGMMQVIEIIPSASMQMQGASGGAGGHSHGPGHSHAPPPAQSQAPPHRH